MQSHDALGANIDLQILKLTLFDVEWPDWTLPYIDVQISALTTYITQFTIAVFCAVMFPFVASKYHQVR
jgi:hypothetical protein